MDSLHTSRIHHDAEAPSPPVGQRSYCADSSELPTSLRDRDALLDLLRSVALIRIILWHLYAQTWLTWIAALPVMFFVLGTVTRPSPSGHLSFVQRRGRRLLVPYWVYGVTIAALASAFAVANTTKVDVSLSQLIAWVLPVVDPTATSWSGGWLSSHLWYLRAVLWITLLTPLLRLAARHLRLTVSTVVIGIALLAVASASNVPYLGSGQFHLLLGDFVVYGFFAVLGIAFGTRSRIGSFGWRALFALFAWTGAIVFASTIGVPAGGVNSSYPLITLLGVATLATLSLVEKPLRALASQPRLAAATRRVSSRALTIYLWHPVCIVGAAHLFTTTTGALRSFGLAFVTFALVGAAVLAFGWIEDLAGSSRRKRADRSKRSRRIGMAAILTVFAAGSFTPGSWVSAAAVRTLDSGTLVPDIPAPSSRSALRDSAFAPTTALPLQPSLLALRTSAATPLSFEPPWTAPTTTAPPPPPVVQLVSTTTPGTPAPAVVPVVQLASTATPGTPAPAATPAKPSTVVVKVRTGTPSPAAKPRVTMTVPGRRAAPTTTLSPAPAQPKAAPAITTSTAAATKPSSPAVATPTPTTLAPLPAEKLQRAFDAWRGQTQPAVSSSVVALRIGANTWTSRSADAGVNSKYLTTSEFRASSITKTFTAALVLRSVDRGDLRLDDQVPSLTGVSVPAPAGLTVRQLLTHTSGLVDYRAAPGYDQSAPLTVADAVALSLRAPLVGAGSRVSYANSNYLHLGLLLEQTTGKSYGQLVRELTTEVGLTETRLDEAPQLGWVGYSSGGIMSTTSDLAKWGQALFTPGKVLTERALTTMTTIGDANVGLGAWPACPCSTDAQGVKRYTAIGHHTADGGMFFFPATGMTIVAMFEPTGHDTHARIVSLATALNAVLA